MIFDENSINVEDSADTMEVSTVNMDDLADDEADNMEDSSDNCNSLVSQWHVESANSHGGPCYYVNDYALRELNQIENVEINFNKDKDREMDESSKTLLHSSHYTLDTRVQCFVCGELVDRHKLSGHLFFGELKCSHCLLEVKTCKQFQAVKLGQNFFQHKVTSCPHKADSCQQYQTPYQHIQIPGQNIHTPSQRNQKSFHYNQVFCGDNLTYFQHSQNFCQPNMISCEYNQTTCQHNQSACQHKDLVWPNSPTPINFLKENLSNEMNNLNVELCCYLAKLNLLSSAKPWKRVIHNYWQGKNNTLCSYCKQSKNKSALKTILSRPFKPKIEKNRNQRSKNRPRFYRNGKNQDTINNLISLNNSKLPSLESEMAEKDSLLKFILNQPVRYNFDIINDKASRKCILQDNEVSSSQSQILLTDHCSRKHNNTIEKVPFIERDDHALKRAKSTRKSRKDNNQDLCNKNSSTLSYIENAIVYEHR